MIALIKKVLKKIVSSKTRRRIKRIKRHIFICLNNKKKMSLRKMIGYMF